MLRERGPTPLHRLSFAPVWTSSAPQEVLEFMLDKAEGELDVEAVIGAAEAASGQKRDMKVRETSAVLPARSDLVAKSLAVPDSTLNGK